MSPACLGISGLAGARGVLNNSMLHSGDILASLREEQMVTQRPKPRTHPRGPTGSLRSGWALGTAWYSQDVA